MKDLEVQRTSFEDALATEASQERALEKTKWSQLVGQSCLRLSSAKP